MNDLDKWDGQYRRPVPHFTEETAVRPTVDRRKVLTGSGILAAFALLMALVLTPTTAADDVPDAQQVRADSQMTTVQGCQLIQHLTYTPCGHKLTRRQALPDELVGQGREAVAGAYDQWQVTSFAAAEVVMEQTIALYCPDHMVIMPNEAGLLCIFQNRYGDALALVRETDVSLNEISEDVQDQVRSGLGFSNLEEAEKWLEGIAS